jgi:asparagine synthase (glutamine-hydrolysing)
VQHSVPKEILERKDKMGFPVPLHEWYLQNPVREFVCDTLTSLRSRQGGFLDETPVETLLDNERSFGRSIWGLLCLELWMQAFLDGKFRDLSAI